MSITGNVYGALGYYSHLRGDLAKAEKYYVKMMKYGCRDAKKVAAYGLVLMRKGEFQQAIDIFNQARSLHPSPDMRSKIRLNRAVAYYKIGDYDRALKALENLQEADGPSERLYETLGYVYLMAGQLDKALAYNTEAVDYEDENHAILDNLGQTYMLLGQWDKAREYCHRAYEQRGNQVDVLYHMAQIELHDGNKEAARAYWEKAKAAPRSALNDVTDVLLEEMERKLNGQ
jgi:tetratricopeptide (TPR) repeat protein